ncbi:MAG: ligase-associated DNA damage response endonuclease PdeM [Bacteroidota bacterium]
MPNRQSIIVEVKGETLELLPERAIWWPAQKSLLIADLHLGKSGHFRSHGIAIPAKVNQTDLKKLRFLIDRLALDTIYFLGDLFHSSYNKEWEAFVALLTEKKKRYVLVKGNHDILKEEKYREAGLELVPQGCEVGPFYLSHEPMEVYPSKKYPLVGHIHPGLRLVGNGRQKLSLPAFAFGQKEGILPAFGTFTGLYILEPEEEDQLFVVAERSVIRVG